MAKGPSRQHAVRPSVQTEKRDRSSKMDFDAVTWLVHLIQHQHHKMTAPNFAEEVLHDATGSTSPNMMKTDLVASARTDCLCLTAYPWYQMSLKREVAAVVAVVAADMLQRTDCQMSLCCWYKFEVGWI